AFGGQTSPPFTVRVVDTRFGIFSVAASGMGPGVIQNFISQAEQPVNSPARPARPRQFVILWGTGLGPISTPEDMSPLVGDLPVEVQISVGGSVVTNKSYSGRSPQFSGVDQINFEVPADAPLGCSVPVVVRAGGFNSNIVTMAISADGSPCSS